MGHRRVLCLFLIAAALVGCGSKETGNDTEKPKAPEAKGTPVNDGSIRLTADQVHASDIETSEVTEERVAPAIAAVGRVKVRSGGEAEVFSPFAGRLIVETNLPRIGETVMKGRHLADVEQQFVATEKLQIAATSIELQTAIEHAQQDLDLKRTELNRAKQLYEGGAIPQRQLQAAEFDVKQAQSKLDGVRRSKEQYDAVISTANAGPRRSPIIAPISGTVISTDATAGQQVEPSKSLLKIVDLGTVWIEAAVHERDLSRIRTAKEARIVIPHSSESFRGKLVTVGNVVDPQNRTVSVIFSVDNRGALLKLEMFVDAHIPAGTPEMMLTIPSSAVLKAQDASFVFVETEAGVYRRRVVALGDRTGQRIVVTSGLQKGEKVVSVGGQILRSESLKGQIPADEDDKKK